jgi:hypothetical protein
MLYSFFWTIPGVLILCADVSEHSASSILLRWCKHTTYEDGNGTVSRNVGTKLKHRRIIKKQEYDIRNTAKVLNQEKGLYFIQDK